MNPRIRSSVGVVINPGFKLTLRFPCQTKTPSLRFQADFYSSLFGLIATSPGFRLTLQFPCQTKSPSLRFQADFCTFFFDLITSNSNLSTSYKQYLLSQALLQYLSLQ